MALRLHLYQNDTFTVDAFDTGGNSSSSVVRVTWFNDVMTVGDGGIGPVSQKLYDTVTGIQSGAIKDPYGNWHVCVED